MATLVEYNDSECFLMKCSNAGTASQKKLSQLFREFIFPTRRTLPTIFFLDQSYNYLPECAVWRVPVCLASAVFSPLTSRPFSRVLVSAFVREWWVMFSILYQKKVEKNCVVSRKYLVGFFFLHFVFKLGYIA